MRRLIFQNSSLFAASLLMTLAAGCDSGNSSPAASVAPTTPAVTTSPDGKPVERFDQPLKISGFNDFALTAVNDAELTELYSALSPNLTRDQWDRCSERAHVWSYQMWRRKGVESGKVFLFYTVTEIQTSSGIKLRKNTGNRYRRDWIWHTAPYVASESGGLYVMDKFEGLKQPKQLKDWLNYNTTNNVECVELKGNEKDIMKWTCGPLLPNGECTNMAPDFIRVPNGGPACYFRRVPEYYTYPRDVANHDYLELPAKTEWDMSWVYTACGIVMNKADEGARNEACMALMSGANALTNSIVGSVERIVPSETVVPQPNIYTGDDLIHAE